MSERTKKGNVKPKKQAWLLPLLCYLLAILVYLGVCLAGQLLDSAREKSGALVRTELYLDDFELEGVLPLDSEDGVQRIVSTDTDPQLVYSPGGPFYVRNMVVNATALNKAPGEMTLYYTTAPGEAFTERQKVWAQIDANGNYVFDLGGRQVYALRFDPDTAGGVIWGIKTITLNEAVPAYQYYLPDARGIFLLLALPLLCWALLRELAALFFPALARMAGKKRGGATLKGN